MTYLRYDPTGPQQWDVRSDKVRIATISPKPDGQLCATHRRVLTKDEASAVSGFIACWQPQPPAFVADLRRLAKGKPTALPERQVITWALNRVLDGLEKHDVAELWRLFGLPDTRRSS